MTTKADLRVLMLAHLRVIRAGETPAAEIATLADFYIDGARGFLSEEGLCWWDADEIPTAVSVPLAHYCAGLAAVSFGKGGKGYEAQGGAAKIAIAGLKSGDDRETVRAEYF